MFQDYKEDLNQFIVPAQVPEHKIKPFDNLYIAVMTIDPEVNRTLNPRMGGEGFSSGTEQMFGSPASQYINGYRVSPDSSVILPILGSVKLVGLNLDEAENLIKTRAEEYLKEPTVQVKFLNFKINVNGEIRNPGIYYNYEGNLNILDIIGMANGITDFADMRNVVVKRNYGNRIYTFKVDFTNKSIYNSEVFYLQPNDFVYIPPTKLKRRAQNSDSYGKVLSTISTLLVVVALMMR